jgi:uncharacterized damage-inducible protein DinB
MPLLPPVPDERTGLVVFLDAQRRAVLGKLDGLSDDEARLAPTASTLSPLAIVKHLGYVERRWFQVTLAGRELPGVWPVEDWAAEFRLDPDDSVESVAAFYRAMVADSAATTATFASPDEPCRHPEMTYLNLRWILLHMIEETARHTGHMDIVRESIDGVTGM